MSDTVRQLRFYLTTDATRLLLNRGSTLIGRSLDCDVVIPDAHVSRHHVLLRHVPLGIEVVPLVRQLTSVNGAPLDDARTLHDGDVLTVATRSFTLRAETTDDPDAFDPWFIEREPGVLVAVGAERLSVGGGPDDRLVVRSWEPAAVILEVVGGRLLAEINAPDVQVDGPCQVGDLVTLRQGSTVSCRGLSLRALALPSDPARPTTRPNLDELPTALALTLLPRGGNLAVTVGARTRKVYLTDKRCDLIAALMQPRGGVRVGDLVADAALIAQLWGVVKGGRNDLNTLVWRLRKDLADAGLEDVPLLLRSKGGVRLQVAEGAKVEVLQE